MSRRRRIAALLIVALVAGLVATACDAFVSYTVANETDKGLLTWASRDSCDKLPGYEYSWFYEEMVQPRESHHYFVGYWGSGPRCVHIATEDRRLVMVEPYEHGHVYVVREPLQALSDPVPQEKDLPSQPWRDSLRENSWSIPVIAVILALFAAIAAGFLFAIFVSIRFFYRYYIKKAP